MKLSTHNPGAGITLRRQQIEYREHAFTMLSDYSPKLVEVARNLTQRYTSGRTNRAGELLPILLSEIVSIDAEQIKKVGGAWFCLYLYTLLLDDQMDNKYQATAAEYMAGTALLSSGLLELRKMVSGTAYEKDFEEAITRAISGQAEDFEGSRQASGGDERVLQSQSKNQYLVALAHAFSAVSGQGEKLVPFVRNLTLAVQYLDDISDFMEDYHDGNFTVLLSKASSKTGSLHSNRSELLLDLVASGALLDVLSSTRDAIDQALMHVDRTDKGALLPYMSTIRSNVVDLICDLSLPRQNHEIDLPSIQEIDRKLTSIAFSS